MAKAYIFLAEGFEEIEGLTPADLLRRAGVETFLVGLDKEGFVTGSHGIDIKTDCSIEEIQPKQEDLLVLPGGMPGTLNLGKNERLKELLEEAYERKGLIAAICAAPSLLGDLGFLKGRRAVCYPGFEERLTGAVVTEELVEWDDHVITSRGMGAAVDFGLTLVEALKGKEEAERIAASIIYRKREEA